MNGNQWARLLAHVTGLVNQELLLQNEYLGAENRILRAHLPARLHLSDPERCTLADIGQRLGRKALDKVAQVAKPDTILAWVPKVDRTEVRRIQTPLLSRPTAYRWRYRSSGGAHGPGEHRLGLRPDRWRT